MSGYPGDVGAWDGSDEPSSPCFSSCSFRCTRRPITPTIPTSSILQDEVAQLEDAVLSHWGSPSEGCGGADDRLSALPRVLC